jgi:hypothetical protein
MTKIPVEASLSWGTFAPMVSRDDDNSWSGDDARRGNSSGPGSVKGRTVAVN